MTDHGPIGGLRRWPSGEEAAIALRSLPSEQLSALIADLRLLEDFPKHALTRSFLKIKTAIAQGILDGEHPTEAIAEMDAFKASMEGSIVDRVAANLVASAVEELGCE